MEEGILVPAVWGQQSREILTFLGPWTPLASNEDCRPLLRIMVLDA